MPRFSSLIIGVCVASISILLAMTTSASILDGVHAYNGGRDKLAQTVLGSYTNINLLTVISTQNTNLDTFYTQDLALQDKQNSILRDLKVFAICNNTNSFSKSLNSEIDNRLCTLLGGAPEVAEGVADNLGNPDALSSAFSTILDLDANTFQFKFNVRPGLFSTAKPLTDTPSPDLLKGRTSENAKDFDALYKGYENTYNMAYTEATKNLGTGELKDAFNAMTAAIADSGQLKTNATALQNEIANETTNITEALKNGTNITTSGVFQNGTNILRELGTTINSVLQSSNSIVVKSGIEVNLATIDEVMAAAVSTPSTTNIAKADPATKCAILITSQLSPLANATGQLESALKMPKISTLLMEKAMLSIQLDAANQDIALQTETVATLQRKYQAMLLEIRMLQEMRQEYIALTSQESHIDPTTAWAKSATNYLGKGESLTNNLADLPTSVLLDPTAPSSCRQPVIAAILKLATSIRVARLRQDDADLELINVEYHSANNANETAILMWNSLIATPVNQIATYYSSGFKPEEVAAILVNAMGLGAIAWRVH